MKLRLNRELHERAADCAQAIGEPLSEYVRCCVIAWKKRKLKGVAVPAELVSATRQESTVITIGDSGLTPHNTRRAIAAATVDAESKRPAPFGTDLIAGRDYIIGEE